MDEGKKTTVVNVYREPYDVCIMRPSIYRNPFRIGDPHKGRDGTREEVVEKFKPYFKRRMHDDLIFCQAVGELRGKRLGCCCCKPKACHGDIIAAWLNREEV